MRLYGAFSQFEFLGDGFVRTPQSQVPRHLALTPCQVARGLFRQARLADAGFQAIGWLIAIAMSKQLQRQIHAAYQKTKLMAFSITSEDEDFGKYPITLF